MAALKVCSHCRAAQPLDAFTRDAARKDGLRRQCRSCEARRRAAYYEVHATALNKASAAWASRNPDRKAAASRRAYHRNPGAFQARAQRRREREDARDNDRATRRRWRRSHPLEEQAQKARRRAREAAASGVSSAAQIRARFEMWGNRCWMCGVPASEIDHLIPLARGGSNWPANIRPACHSCNSRKGARTPKEIAA